jgi:hypothetical protein
MDRLPHCQLLTPLQQRLEKLCQPWHSRLTPLQRQARRQSCLLLLPAAAQHQVTF